MSFSACGRRSCVIVPFVDNDVVEETELIHIRLVETANVNNRITVDVSSAVIEVADDNDSKLCNIRLCYVHDIIS